MQQHGFPGQISWNKFPEYFFLNMSRICGNKMPTRCNRWFLLQILLLAQHVSGTSSKATARKPDTQPSAPHHTDNLKTKHQIRQATTTCIILSSSWWWAQWCPKYVEQAMRSAIKIHLLHLVSILVPHIVLNLLKNMRGVTLYRNIVPVSSR